MLRNIVLAEQALDRYENKQVANDENRAWKLWLLIYYLPGTKKARVIHIKELKLEINPKERGLVHFSCNGSIDAYFATVLWSAERMKSSERR